MSKYLSYLLFAFCFFICCNKLHAQATPADTVQQRLLATNLEAVYKKSMGAGSRLYNGFAYHLYTASSPGNAYFKDSTRVMLGSIKYDGIEYKDVPILYDLYADLVISSLQNNILLYSFLTEKVSYFDVMGHHFINMQPVVSNRPLTSGFYDELYHKKMQLFARRTKNIQKTINYNVAQVLYLPKTNFYLKKNGVYYDVSSKGKFFDVLNDKKKELKKQLKAININYSDNPEQAMIALCTYYDSLTN